MPALSDQIPRKMRPSEMRFRSNQTNRMAALYGYLPRSHVPRQLELPWLEDDRAFAAIREAEIEITRLCREEGYNIYGMHRMRWIAGRAGVFWVQVRRYYDLKAQAKK